MELANTLPTIRLRVVGTAEPLLQPENDPLHGWSFAYVVEGQYAPAVPESSPGARLDRHPPKSEVEWLPRFRVYAQKREQFYLARRACRYLLRCFEFALGYLQRDHRSGSRSVLSLHLCTGGKPGAEQTRNLLYLYRVDPALPPIEWARELAHEYGHAIVPPINSFKEPETWANGDLGERLFLSWCLAAMVAKRLTPEDVMEASEEDLRRYCARSVEPLIARMEREGLNLSRWRSRRRDGYEEYLALALYTERLFGYKRLQRAMVLAGGTEPDDFLNGLREAIWEASSLEVTLRLPRTWLLLPGGLKRWQLNSPPAGIRLLPDRKRPDWIQVEVKDAPLPVHLQLRRLGFQGASPFGGNPRG